MTLLPLVSRSGYLARLSGVPLSRCPYSTVEAMREWSKGWWDANREVKAGLAVEGDAAVREATGGAQGEGG